MMDTSSESLLDDIDFTPAPVAETKQEEEPTSQFSESPKRPHLFPKQFQSSKIP